MVSFYIWDFLCVNFCHLDKFIDIQKHILFLVLRLISYTYLLLLFYIFNLDEISFDYPQLLVQD